MEKKKVIQLERQKRLHHNMNISAGESRGQHLRATKADSQTGGQALFTFKHLVRRSLFLRNQLQCVKWLFGAKPRKQNECSW